MISHELKGRRKGRTDWVAEFGGFNIPNVMACQILSASRLEGFGIMGDSIDVASSFSKAGVEEDIDSDSRVSAFDKGEGEGIIGASSGLIGDVEEGTVMGGSKLGNRIKGESHRAAEEGSSYLDIRLSNLEPDEKNQNQGSLCGTSRRSDRWSTYVVSRYREVIGSLLSFHSLHFSGVVATNTYSEAKTKKKSTTGVQLNGSSD